MFHVSPNTATVRLTVTIVRDGDDTVSREFVAETSGTARRLRAAYDVCNALLGDAQKWLSEQDKSRRTPGTPGARVTPLPVNVWQRTLLALARLPVPTRTTLLVASAPEPVRDPDSMHTAAVSISVDSVEMVDTVSVGGNTNGSPYRLAHQMLFSVVTDMRDRVSEMRFALEDAK